DAAQSELHHTPVVPGCAATAALPAVHPLAAVGVFVRNENAATGFEEIFLLREELVVSHQRLPSDALRRQIDQAGGCGIFFRCAHSMPRAKDAKVAKVSETDLFVFMGQTVNQTLDSVFQVFFAEIDEQANPPSWQAQL